VFQHLVARHRVRHGLKVAHQAHGHLLERGRAGAELVQALLDHLLLLAGLLDVLLHAGAELRIVLQALGLALGQLQRLALQRVGVAEPDDQDVLGGLSHREFPFIICRPTAGPDAGCRCARPWRTEERAHGGAATAWAPDDDDGGTLRPAEGSVTSAGYLATVGDVFFLHAQRS
jgi:hypothetical protein